MPLNEISGGRSIVATIGVVGVNRIEQVSFQFDQTSKILGVSFPQKLETFVGVTVPLDDDPEWTGLPWDRFDWAGPVKLESCYNIGDFHAEESAVIENCSIKKVFAVGNIFLRNCCVEEVISKKGDLCLVECSDIKSLKARNVYYEKVEDQPLFLKEFKEQCLVFDKRNREANKGPRILLDQGLSPSRCTIQ